METIQITKNENVFDVKKGTILHTSWGYDMTINDFCIVLENTGKTLKCQMLGKIVSGDGVNFAGNERAKPTKGVWGKPFRLKIESRDYKGINARGYNTLFIRGSYPFINNAQGSKRFGYWSIADREEYYENTWD